MIANLRDRKSYFRSMGVCLSSLVRTKEESSLPTPLCQPSSLQVWVGRENMERKEEAQMELGEGTGEVITTAAVRLAPVINTGAQPKCCLLHRSTRGRWWHH